MYFLKTYCTATILIFALVISLSGAMGMPCADTDQRPWHQIVAAGMKLLEAGKYMEAYEEFNAASVAAAKSHGKNSDDYATTLYHLGSAARRINRYEEAERLLLESYKLKKSILGDNNVNVGRVGNAIGVLYYDEGRLLEASEYFEEGLRIELSASKDKDLSYGIMANNLAELYMDLGKLQQAKKLRLEAVDIIQRSAGKKSLDYSGALRSRADLYIALGDLQSAEQDLTAAEEIVRSLHGKNHPDYAATLMVKSRLNDAKGQFYLNELVLLEALEVKIAVFGDKHMETARSYMRLGDYYDKLGDLQMAKSNYRSALVIIARNIGTTNAIYAIALTSMGTVLEKLGAYDDAHSHYANSINIWESYYGPTHSQYLVTINAYGAFLSKIGEYEGAETLLNMSVEKRAQVYGKNSIQYARAINNLSALYSDLKRYQEAVRLQDENLKIRRATVGEGHPEYARALANAAYINELAGNIPTATKYYKEAFSIYSKQIEEVFPYLSERERLLYFGTLELFRHSFAAFTIDFYAQAPELAGMLYDFQIAFKGILFRTASQMTSVVQRSSDQALKAEYKQWLDLKNQLTSALQMSNEELLNIGVDIARLRAGCEVLEKSISRKSAQYTALIGGGNAIGWKSVQKQLATGEYSVEIVRARRYKPGNDTTYVALILGPNDLNGPRIIEIPNGKALESRHIQGYHNAVKFQVDDSRSFDNFWSPLAPMLSGAKRIYFSGDGVYHKLNLNTLKNKITSKYLGEEVEVTLVGNTRDIARIKQSASNKTLPSQGYELIGFPDYGSSKSLTPAPQISGMAIDTVQRFLSREGNITPLPGTQREVEAIAKLLQAKGLKYNTYMGPQASEQSIRSLNEAAVLHIATHGFFLADVAVSSGEVGERRMLGIDRDQLVINPLLRSGLLMAGAELSLKAQGQKNGTDDGIFNAQEASNLNLSGTKLVVLSACETGLGEISDGEGVFGLPRAFLQAGAETVIMSLWTVSDEVTQMLMASFYAHWLNGHSRQEAFSKAQAEIRAKYPQPYYWGAFVMIGLP